MSFDFARPLLAGLYMFVQGSMERQSPGEKVDLRDLTNHHEKFGFRSTRLVTFFSKDGGNKPSATYNRRHVNLGHALRTVSHRL